MGAPDQADQRHMRRALRLARRGDTSPNPQVGAVLVRDGEVVGEGYHTRAGAPHAEVEALKSAGAAARGATLYVTLEPCNHHGRTPPCTEAVIAAGVSRVVVGALDLHPHVPGSAERLRAAGIVVERGVCGEEAAALVRPFFKHLTTGLPYVCIKAAVTLDGRMATRTFDSKWITSDASRKEAHRLRAESDAVLVGVSTVLADDPRLNVRAVEGRDPLRVVVDTSLRTPVDAAVLQGEPGATLVLHAADASPARVEALRAAGAVVHDVPRGPSGLDLGAVLRVLGERNVVRLLVEGGGRVHGSLLDAGLADHASVFVAPIIVGDAAAPAFASGRGSDTMAGSYRIANARVRRRGPDVWMDGPLVKDRSEDK
ncbi:MAG: bifunctional diaminohydroxyphosphoribosylaminopyrimidine deaminase/5-amino-6-(5-phosphoribosylamino)uracil reductase RibD [Sandaracinaceae bacterium]|nr:bifunctional diaminohydroxyphosphoribosylaminopyrimidine deaminase/5-amino-6-(5-phosphoribosylamino)uracil reductase RibD [Sandaracinaceae bacterium]